MTIRRLKTYTGSQGYVYQYYFVGKRLAAASDAHKSDAHRSEANEYIFDVTSDRKLTYAVSIFLPQQVVAAWAEFTDAPSPIPNNTLPSRCVSSALSTNWETCRRKAANCGSTRCLWRNRWRGYAWNEFHGEHATVLKENRRYPGDSGC